MKKAVAFMISMALGLSLVGCGGKKMKSSKVFKKTFCYLLVFILIMGITISNVDVRGDEIVSNPDVPVDTVDEHSNITGEYEQLGEDEESTEQLDEDEDTTEQLDEGEDTTEQLDEDEDTTEQLDEDEDTTEQLGKDINRVKLLSMDMIIPAVYPTADTGEKLTLLNFTTGADPGSLLDATFKTAAGGDSKQNIEGPEGSNCATGSDWKSNGNLSIVDATAELATSTNAVNVLINPNVLKFYLHDNKDYDRNTTITDRQRIEIKTEAKNENISSYFGDIITNHWKFFIPNDVVLPGEEHFFHIFQTKATQGDESSMPVFTFTATKDTLYFHGSDRGHVHSPTQAVANREIAYVSMSRVQGKWMEAEVTTYAAEKGHVYVHLQDVSDPENPVELINTGFDIDTWRRNEEEIEDNDGNLLYYDEIEEPAAVGQLNRSKWGLYRANSNYLDGNGRPIIYENFGEATMYIGDLWLMKRNPLTYQFPDGYYPNGLTKDVTWVVEPDSVQVELGTDFSAIDLPSTVDVYIEANDKKTVKVTWLKENYDKGELGTYTITGTLDNSIYNPNGIMAQMDIIVANENGNIKVNWALNSAKGGAASIKTISYSGDDVPNNFIDGDLYTFWKTHSSVVQLAEDWNDPTENNGIKYWAAVDLGDKRDFDEIFLALGTIGSSKQFRLKNYTIYYSNDTGAYNAINAGKTGDVLSDTNNVTKNPRALANFSQNWTQVPGAFAENVRDPDTKKLIHKAVTNNIKHTYNFPTISARYVLLVADVENYDATAGAIAGAVIKVLGEVEPSSVNSIVSVANVPPITRNKGTEFLKLGLPDNISVAVDDGEGGTRSTLVNVTWDDTGYDMYTLGVYSINGILSFPANVVKNPNKFTAKALVKIIDPPDVPTRVNWLGAGNTAEVKVISDTNGTPAGVSVKENLIDNALDTYTATHSAFIAKASEFQYKYWVAIKLEESKNIDEFYIKWRTVTNYLKNARIYYSNTSSAYDNLLGRNGSFPTTAGTDTANPQLTHDPTTNTNWKMVDGAYLAGTIANSKEWTVGLTDPINAKYLLLVADVVDFAPGTAPASAAISAWVFRASGPDGPAITRPEITGITNPAKMTVPYGTAFGDLQLPQKVAVQLADATSQEVNVVWSASDYNKNLSDTYTLAGDLMIFTDTMKNTGGLQAKLEVEVVGAPVASHVSVTYANTDNTQLHFIPKVAAGTKLSLPEIPADTKGYVVSGWYKDKALTHKWDFGKDRVPDTNLTLYAKWTGDCTVTFLDDLIELSKITSNYNTPLGSRMPKDPTKEKFIFNGWNTKPDGNGAYFNASTVVTASITVYATWASNSGDSSSSSSDSSSSSGSPNVESMSEISGATMVVSGTTDKNNNGIVVVTEQQLNQLLQNLKKAAAADDKQVVTLKLDMPENSNALNITLPKSSLLEIANNTKASVAIDTGLTGVVTFNNAALKNITSKAMSNMINIAVSKVNLKELSEKQQNIVGDRPVVSYTILDGDSKISEFGFNGEASITLDYKLRAGEKADKVVVFHIDTDGNMTPQRTKYNSKEENLEFKTNHFSEFMVGYNDVSFSDIPNSADYKAAVDFIAARRITLGMENDMFAPENNIKRADFLIMLMKAYDIDMRNVPVQNFADAGNTYYTPYLAVAKKMGIASSVDGKNYDPDGTLTREMMYTLVYRTAAVLNEVPKTDKNKMLLNIADSDQVSDYAKEAITALYAADAIYFKNEGISPKANASRSDMARVLYALLK